LRLQLTENKTGLVGAVGIEIASLTSKSFEENGVALPPNPNWSLLEPRLGGLDVKPPRQKSRDNGHHMAIFRSGYGWN
jgi:hypothetical protein